MSPIAKPNWSKHFMLLFSRLKPALLSISGLRTLHENEPQVFSESSGVLDLVKNSAKIKTQLQSSSSALLATSSDGSYYSNKILLVTRESLLVAPGNTSNKKLLIRWSLDKINPLQRKGIGR